MHVPQEGSITAIHNWRNDNKWSHCIIKDGKALKISEEKWHEYRKAGAPVNQSLYAEDIPHE